MKDISRNYKQFSMVEIQSTCECLHFMRMRKNIIIFKNDKTTNITKSRVQWNYNFYDLAVNDSVYIHQDLFLPNFPKFANEGWALQNTFTVMT